MIARITPFGSERPVNAEPIVFRMPPDKSILHRLLFIGSLTTSRFHIPISSPSAISDDVIATVLALESLGVPVDVEQERIELHGVGRRGYRAPTHAINCANSGTTARLLIGLLAGQTFNSTLTGDTSLSTRPMKRLANLLSEMDAIIATDMRGTLPLEIAGQQLHGAEITLPVASAQIKSALMLAGLFADTPTIILEPAPSRDHTERMMEAFGFGIEDEDRISIFPEITSELSDEIVYNVPGDFSCAAFLIAAAVLLRKRLVVEAVLLNPSRTRFLDILSLMGIEIEADHVTEEWNEARGRLTVYGDLRTEPLVPFQIDGGDVPLLIDELPILMVLAMFADGENTITGAAELRLKESDRLALTAKQFKGFGVNVVEMHDGISIEGIPDRVLLNAPIHHGGDHRLLMAFSIAALFRQFPTEIEDADAASVSYPEFFSHLHRLCGNGLVELSTE
jgi:3-phosphoshikimate 1-carboxyvinyltransferase